MAGAAAVDMLNALDLSEGSPVLISGATGGVGVLATQMAAQRGARVIATAKPGDADVVRQLGAHEVVDYTQDVSAAVRAIRPDGVDAVHHLAGDGLELARLLVPGGGIALSGRLYGRAGARAGPSSHPDRGCTGDRDP